MAKRDYYEVLGVARDADEDALKKAFRRLAMKHHPDRNEGDEEAERSFKEAKEAFEVLGDPHKRTAYDRFGHEGVKGGPGGFGGGGGFDPSEAFGDIFGDVFGDIFGQGRRSRSRVFRGADLRYELALDLEQAVFGDEVEINFPTIVSCGTCDGSGAAAGSEPVRCNTCNGQGQVQLTQGPFRIQQACPRCHGKGKTIEDPCKDCGGAGRVRKRKRLSVNVPAGVDDGDRVRLVGEGEPGQNGGPSGDLYVQIDVREHEIFQRDGANLACEVPVSIGTATLGGEVIVPTLEGDVRLKVPAETQSGKTFRLRGKGVRTVRSDRQGDLFCAVTVETPVRLSKEQRVLLEEFEASLTEGGDVHRPRATSWLDGVKRFFSKLGADQS